ncbi:MAG: OadG family transporter subunit [Bacteroidales bacterium]
MKKLTKIFLLLGVLISVSNLQAQNMSDMRLNEIVVTNTDGYVDDYGNRSGWIELFNTSYGTVDVGGCYLTDDPNNLKKYMIPKGDVLTKVKPRQHILFYADNLPDRGTFHISFNLDTSKEILFVSSDGRTIVDKIILPQIPENLSYGRLNDGEGVHEPVHFLKKSYNLAQKEVVSSHNGGWGIIKRVTPSSNNVIQDGQSKALALLESDPFGAVMSLTAMTVVFLALILLYVFFRYIGRYYIQRAADNAKKAAGITATSEKKQVETSGDISAEVYAAIAMAFHCYKIDSEAHDIENTILTINKVSKSYSPWSSKIYSLRETPQLHKK